MTPDEAQTPAPTVADAALLRLVSDVGDVLVQSANLDETLPAALRLLVPGLADWVAIDLLGEERATFSASALDADATALVEWLRSRYRTADVPSQGALAVARTGVPELLRDLREVAPVAMTDEESAAWEALGMRSALFVPLVVDGERLGALTWLTRTAERTYDHADLTIAEAFGRRFAQGVLTARRRRRAAFDAALLDAMYRSVSAGVAVFDRRRRYVRVNERLAHMNRLPVERHIGRRVPDVLGEAARSADDRIGQVLASGEAQHDIEFQGPRAGAPDEIGWFLASYVPVEVEGERVGVTATVTDVTALKRAEHESAHLRRHAEEQLALLDAMNASTAVGLAFFDRELRFARINKALADINGVPPEAHIGRTTGEVLGELGAGQADIIRDVLRTGVPALDLDVSGETPAQPGVTRHWLVSYTPVRLDGEVIGVLGSALEVSARVRAEQEREQAYRRAHFLARASELLDASLDVHETLEALAELAVPAVADWCLVRLVTDDRTVELVAAAHGDARVRAQVTDANQRWPVQVGEGLGEAEVLRTGRLKLMADVGDADIDAIARSPEHRALLHEIGVASLLIAPLTARGRTLGTITFIASDSARRFTEQDAELAEELGRRAGLAIHTAQLYSEHRDIAHELQARLLPSVIPAVPGAEVAVRYRAAGTYNEVGGDFYDVFERGDGEWVLLVGDIAGKGPAAAALTALVRHTVRAVLLRSDSVRDAFAQACDALVRETEDGNCTLALALVRPGSDGARLRVALAGHPPPMVRRRDGRVDEVGSAGPLLCGAVSPAANVAEAALGPGDTLLLYTDGAVDAAVPRPGWGEDALRQLLADRGDCSAQELVETVEEAAVRAAQGRPRDDIALVALRMSG